jgi:phage-related protein
VKELQLREITWIGNSLDNLKEFPIQVRQHIGMALDDVQNGTTPSDVKAFKDVGSGVYEIVSRFDTNTYRAVYAVKIGEDVYVLHAFQKKSKKGVATPKQDVDLIKARYKKALEVEKDKKDDKQ